MIDPDLVAAYWGNRVRVQMACEFASPRVPVRNLHRRLRCARRAAEVAPSRRSAREQGLARWLERLVKVVEGLSRG